MRTLILLVSAFYLGCATTQQRALVDKTIYSDVFPQEITRSQYYHDLALGHINYDDYDKAVELLKLSLLHNSENEDSRYWLAVAYFRKSQNSLALNELEKIQNFSNLEYAKLKLVSDIYEKADAYEKVIEINDLIFAKQNEKFPIWKIYQMNMNLKRYSSAEKQLKKLHELGEEKYRLHLGKYEIYARQRMFEQALVELSNAEKEKPFDAMIMQSMIALQFDLKKWNDLYSLGLKYSKYHPYNVDVSERLSQACIVLRQYDEALAELKKQKEYYPDSVGIEFKIAHTLFLKRDFMSAEELYKELYDITKSDKSVFYISQIHLMQNNYISASQSLESLASWSEYYPTAQVQLARLEWKNYQSDLALNRLRRAHQLRPDSLEIYQEYGQYMIWSKKYVEAIALVEQGIKSYPEDDKLRIQAAYIHFKLNSMKNFKRQIEIAQRINPNNSEIYSVLAELWYEKKKPYNELEYLAQKAIELNTKNKNVKPLLAWALLRQERLTEAVKLFEEFYDKNPNEAFYAESLAEIYEKNVLATKNNEYSSKAVALKADQKIKSDLDYFQNQGQADRTPMDEAAGRLPASLVDP